MSKQNHKKTELSESGISNQDMYSVFQNSINRYFNEIKGNTADYLQAVTDLQQEIIESREKHAKNTIALQKTMSEQLGMTPNNSNGFMELAKSLEEQTTKSWNLQNQLMIKSLDTLSKNIKAFNKNTESFEAINKNLINSWASIIKQTAKENTSE